MSGTKIIKQLLAERNLTINQLSELLNIQPQSMRNKLYRDKFSFADMCKICHVLGADLCAITQDTHKEFYGNLEHSAAPQETRPIPLDVSDRTKCSVSSGIDLPKQPENIDSDFQRDVLKSTEQSTQDAIQKWKAQNPPLTNRVRSASRAEEDAPQPSKEGLNDLLERLRKEHAVDRENGC